MASEDRTPPRTPAPQSIPLQNLSRPPDVARDVRDRIASEQPEARTSRHLHSRSLFSRASPGPQYERLAATSPTRNNGSYHARASSHAGPALNIPRLEVTEEPVSPIADLGNFAAASLGIHLDSQITGMPRTPPPRETTRPSIVRTSTDGRGRSYDTAYSEASFYPNDSDTTPLTSHNRPTHDANNTPLGQRHDRQHNRTSVHWVDGETPVRLGDRPSPRLGDDLPHLDVEHGVRRNPSTASAMSGLSVGGTPRSERSRSLSPGPSPMSRANTMLRAISQRVVNLSNDSDTVEQTIRRKSSLKHATKGDTPRPSMDIGREPSVVGGVRSARTSTDEKSREPSIVPMPLQRSKQFRTMHPNPLRGRSWGIFGPENRFRKALCEMLVHPITEPVILVMIVAQTVLLAVSAAPNAVYHESRSRVWGQSYVDWAILGLFIIYTLELIARTIVSGFMSNPIEYSTIDRSGGVKSAIFAKARNLFALEKKLPKRRESLDGPLQPSIVRTFTLVPDAEMPGHGRQQQRIRLARRAFLRHSFNRLDFVAVVAYWVSFGMQIGRYEMGRHVYIFNMLSCLRILRLLGLTGGTSIILRSLKRAAPLLVNVAFLIGFFWLLFAIVGVQSFKSSLRRTCVWINPEPGGQNFIQNDAPETIQFCGGYLDAVTGQRMPWLNGQGLAGTGTAKGYLCPQGSLCIEGKGPYNGTVSFDNIFQSLELVFVVISSNTFSDLMYYLTDSDYLAAAVFFAAGIVIMSFWLMNLLVAVITSSFQVIREESQQSAFTAEHIDHAVSIDDEPERIPRAKQWFDKTYWLWIAVVAYSIVVQCLRSASQGPAREQFIMDSESAVTFALLLEIILRFACNWRRFHESRQNWVDLILVVATMIIQLPFIRNSPEVYAWCTTFQIIRIYRLVLAVRVTRELVMVVFGNIVGLLNLIVFVFLFTFLTAILASQLFRGDFPVVDASGSAVHITFANIYNSFIGIYQVLSSENWTILLYNSTQFDLMFDTAWLGAVFFIMWFIVANFVILNMFIAVIQESFDITEDEKRLQQVKAFLRQKEMSGSSNGNLSLSSILRFGRTSMAHREALEYGAATLEQLLKDAVVKDFLDENEQPALNQRASMMPTVSHPVVPIQPGLLSSLWTRLTGLGNQNDPNPFYSNFTQTRANEEFDPKTAAKQVISASENRRRLQRQYLAKHPNYNVSLFVFKPQNKLRRYCQYIVGPGRGDGRVEGVSPYKPVWYGFSAFIYAAIVCMVILACITTPLYQREYYETHSLSITNWFVWVDLGFAALFTLEAVIKVIADGFFFTPNAYFRGLWGFIDGIVLITLWVNVVTSLFRDDGVSRAVGAFKALRALRLLNISDSARKTFYSVIVIGGYKVVSAAFVSLSLLIPFAILGLNIFNGQFQSCNDDNVLNSNLTNCIGEFNSTPFNWPVLAPRQVSNPYYSFDDFANSLFILFQIVSQEGWTDVMWSAMSMTGVGVQPQNYAATGNAVFFIIFNILGSVFVLTLFVSVFMRNYTEQTGVAFLTADQRSWLELRKLLKQISPSKRSLGMNANRLQKWCYKLSVQKHGFWYRLNTGLLVADLILLMIEFYPSVAWWDTTRTYLFLALTLIFLSNILIRIIGLSWKRFTRSSWDLFSIPSVGGSLVTSLLFLSQGSDKTIEQLHKLFLVSVAFLLIPRNDQLDQLFKTAAASLPLIGNLMATWFVLFLVYAIAMTQAFGLTRFGSNENGNLNFRNVPKALILLFRMSCGEGWNAIMEDFASIEEPFCVRKDNFFQSDCGSTNWARALFISWNIISMYIFVSLFVSLIFESFSYVYQQSGGRSIVSREEIRRFKHAWSDFDPNGTGWIPKEVFPRLLGELSGVFQMRIYDGDFMVKRLVEDCSIQPGESTHGRRIAAGIDLEKLNSRLNLIPVVEIRQRRARMNVFYEEALLSADLDRGISFTSCLMILAHYNVINDTKSLRLEEFLRRRARLQRVHETIRRNVVVAWFDMMYWSKRLRRIRAARKGSSDSKLSGPLQINVPEIFIDNPDDNSVDESSASTEPHDFIIGSSSGAPRQSPYAGSSASLGGPSRLPNLGLGALPRLDTMMISPRSSTSQGRPSFEASPVDSPILTPTRLRSMDTSYHGARLSTSSPTTPTGHSRAQSTDDNGGLQPQSMMQSFDNSAWGESLRRSFSILRRPSRTD